MEKKFKKGDKVVTNTHAVYQDTQQSLSKLKGEVVNNSDYPYNIHVKVQIPNVGKKVVGFSEFELSKIS